MRARLLRAVNAVLADPAVRDLPDAAKLAALVLLAKAKVSEGLWVRCTVGQLGRWLGCTESHVEHNVLPPLRAGGVIESQQDKIGGEVVGLRCRLTQLVAASEDKGDHPMRLLRQDLAVLLRLLEALIGEGWAPKDGRVTPPGLLAARCGRGAATDRLALVLLVLRTRANGRVCLVGGSVARKRGRPAATVAKVLGCGVSGAGKVLARLREAGVVETPRSASRTGAFGRALLVVPAILEAHGGAAPGPSGLAGPVCRPAGPASDPELWDGPLIEPGEEPREVEGEWLPEELAPSFWQRPAAAVGDQSPVGDAHGGALAVVVGVSGVADVDLAQRPAGADMHTDHTPVVADVPVSAGLGSGCSGFAVAGYGTQPERANAREFQAMLGTVASPLRGEHPHESAWDVPADLADVLRPVAWLWSQVERPGSRRWLADQVRSELLRTSGLAHSIPAARVLSDRLRRRWQAQRGAGVMNPVAWFRARGLPQRSWCWSELCDEGRRVDTGRPCESCEERRLESQGLRAWVTAQTCAVEPLSQVEMDRVVHRAVQARAAEAQEYRDLRARRRAEQEDLRARRREEARVERELREDLPCSGCGMPKAAGSCPGCAFVATAREALTEAAYLALVEKSLAGKVESSVALAELDRCRAQLTSWVSEEVSQLPEAVGPGAAYVQLQVAERIRAQVRERVLAALADSPAVVEEARRARRCVLHEAFRYASREKLEKAAAKAYGQAVAKTSGLLLTRRLSALRAATVAPAPQRVWKERLSELAARPVASEHGSELDVA